MITNGNRLRGLINDAARQAASRQQFLVALLLAEIGHHHAQCLRAKLLKTFQRNVNWEQLADRSAEMQFHFAADVRRLAEERFKGSFFRRGNDIKNGAADNLLERLADHVGETAVAVENGAVERRGCRTL